jgi:hypothetical protein
VSHDELIRRFIENGRRAQAAVNFEIAKAELRKLGITLTQRPGEYQLNLTGGPDANALTAETLPEAVQLGIDMAKTFPPATPAHLAAKIPPGKVLTGKDALDLAKAIAQDPRVNARPENRQALEELVRVHCGGNRSIRQKTPTPAAYDTEGAAAAHDPRSQSPRDHAGIAPAEANYRRQK